MKKTALTAAFTAAALTLSSLAFAQGNSGGRGDQELPRHGKPPSHSNARPGEHNQRPGPQRMETQQHNGPGQAQSRGAGPDHRFHKGGRLPAEYRNRQYVVDDWRGHHLHAPPRGYHWVQTGGDYVLVAITTGIIAQIMLGNF
ncbi:regulator RcnB of Ni and Co efflux [Rhodoferax sp. OV413]|uniref:RcnB family protein n=1 Tax=Rhodoferax sp. OV413 TaxID=1855285 RepID=UPI000889823A|nr:RcnB family protein [Rhodoferax sp. OV413]SDO09732.1 regulator RcnB of Ni and Co efflux [Rhodoferax sp. OV413]